MMAEQLSPTTEATPTTPAAPARADKERQKRWLIIGGGIAVVVLLLALLIIGTILAVQHPTEAGSVRDVAIIVVAIMSFVISFGLLALLYEVTRLTLLLRDEIKPLLESVNEMMNTVRGTTVFMSDNVVQPTIKVASTLAGVRRALESLAGIRSSVQPKQRKE